MCVISSSGLVPRRGHREVAEAAIRGGATAIQLRAPELSDQELLPLAMVLADRCRSERVMFILNNRLDVAAAGGADGAHVGQSDDISGARSAIGGDRALGVSVRGPQDVPAAEIAGADYLGVTVWETATKPEAEPLGLEGVEATACASRLPVVGIGGIDASNAAEVIGAGAAGVAVVSSVGAAEDPVAATRALVKAVRTAKDAT
ncbi:MAG: thiamine phosphate synthase [Actinomycetota bacterium]